MSSFRHNGIAVLEILPVIALVAGLAIGTFMIQHPTQTKTLAASCSGSCNYGYCPSGYSTSTIGCTAPYVCCTYVAPTPTPAQYTCNGVCLNASSPCYSYGTGTCSGSNICCTNQNPPIIPTSTPNPTPTPKYCCTGGNSYPGLCNGQTTYAACQNSSSYGCSWLCTVPITPSPTPAPSDCCTGGSAYPGLCHGQTSFSACTAKGSYGCTWSCNYGMCANINGVTFCKQTDPFWGDQTMPAGCTDANGATDTVHNKIKYNACGIATACSALCSTLGGKYCDLGSCIQQETAFQQITCKGSNMDDFKQRIFNKYPDKVKLVNLKLDTYNDNFGTGTISWEKINANLKYGPVIIGGIFKDSAGVTHRHYSTIVGIDPATGKHIFNDPFFNKDNNINPIYKVPNSFVEDYLTVIPTSAWVVEKP